MLVQHIQVNRVCDDLAAKLHCLYSLCRAKVPIGGARDVVVPDPATDRIKHDPLKAVILPHRPVAFGCARKHGHHCAGQIQILLDKGAVGSVRQIEIVLHLVVRWWVGLRLIGIYLIPFRVEPRADYHLDANQTKNGTA